MGKRTPRRKSSRASTPSVHRLARRLKRQSVPFSLSKRLSVFEDDAKGIFKGSDEGFQLKRNGQELNEMIRDKVSETVVKMKEVYICNVLRCLMITGTYCLVTIILSNE